MSSIENELKMEYASINTIISNLSIQLENAKKRRDVLYKELTRLEIRREIVNNVENKQSINTEHMLCMN
tara:strand:+ start:1009 stop:1215 length:207 start_codon:yes stop_codon:yes gene_type:complete